MWIIQHLSRSFYNLMLIIHCTTPSFHGIHKSVIENQLGNFVIVTKSWIRRQGWGTIVGTSGTYLVVSSFDFCFYSWYWVWLSVVTDPWYSTLQFVIFIHVWYLTIFWTCYFSFVHIKYMINFLIEAFFVP